MEACQGVFAELQLQYQEVTSSERRCWLLAIAAGGSQPCCCAHSATISGKTSVEDAQNDLFNHWGEIITEKLSRVTAGED